MNTTTTTLIVVVVFGAILASGIAYAKDQRMSTFWGFLIVGALLPLIGVIAAVFHKAPEGPPQPPGWYPDPWTSGESQRWYDGYQWTYGTHP